MGIFSRLFGSKKTNLNSNEMNHPVFGPIYMDTDTSWFSESSMSIGCEGTPSLSIDGDENGPFADSATTYEKLKSDWESIAPKIADPLLELNANYFSDEPELQIRDTQCLWESATLLSICVGTDGNLSMTYTFDWQRPGDGHEITVYLENWNTKGVSVDG